MTIFGVCWEFVRDSVAGSRTTCFCHRRKILNRLKMVFSGINTSFMQRFFSYILIVVMSLGTVIPAAIPFYEICRGQLTGAVLEDLVEEGFAEIEKETCAYSSPVLVGPGKEPVLPAAFVFPCIVHPASQFLPGLVDVPPELS